MKNSVGALSAAKLAVVTHQKTRFMELMAGTHYPCSQAVNTGVILDTREHGPSRSAGAIVNGVTTIFYLRDWCPK